VQTGPAQEREPAGIDAEALARRAGRAPSFREGIVLNIPNLTIEVAQECSSIRSSLVLIITTMVPAHLFLRTFWKQALLVALPVPLAVAKNAVRIVTIGLLGTLVDPGYRTGRLQTEGGMIFFCLALLIIGLLLWVMRRTEHRTTGLPALMSRALTAGASHLEVV
jgi:exosortase